MKILATAGVVLLAGVVSAACSSRDVSAPPVPTPAATASSASSAPSVSSTPSRVASAGADGLTVRYASADGQTRTLRVEDFPR